MYCGKRIPRPIKCKSALVRILPWNQGIGDSSPSSYSLWPRLSTTVASSTKYLLHIYKELEIKSWANKLYLTLIQ